MTSTNNTPDYSATTSPKREPRYMRVTASQLENGEWIPVDLEQMKRDKLFDDIKKALEG